MSPGREPAATSASPASATRRSVRKRGWAAASALSAASVRMSETAISGRGRCCRAGVRDVGAVRRLAGHDRRHHPFGCSSALALFAAHLPVEAQAQQRAASRPSSRAAADGRPASDTGGSPHTQADAGSGTARTGRASCQVRRVGIRGGIEERGHLPPPLCQGRPPRLWSSFVNCPGSGISSLHNRAILALQSCQ